MELILSDRPLSLPAAPQREYIDLSQKKITPCVGCFGCWVKTPGRCVIRDDAPQIYPLIARSHRVLYVSQVIFGSWAPRMKAMLERSLPIQQAFLRLHMGETHHVQRLVEEKEAVILAYGPESQDEKDLFFLALRAVGPESQEEKDLFCRLVERNRRNMNFKSYKVLFCREEEVQEAAMQEVLSWNK